MKNNKKPLLVGNWKMNPSTLEEATKRFQAIQRNASLHKGFDVVICPPFPFVATLASIANKDRKIGVGAQDCSIFEDGSSRTGDVSAKMIQSTGANYVIVGHSERRALGDTGETISLKIQEALKTSLNIIVCVGEKERDADGGYFEVIKAQLKEVLSRVDRSNFHRIIIAYEPVWAIGRKDNVALTSYDLHQMVVYIKKFFKETWGETISSMTKILYGGSVNGSNAEDIMWNGEVDGLLIGRSSYEAESFGEIFSAISDADKNSSTQELKKTLQKAHDQKKGARPESSVSASSRLSSTLHRTAAKKEERKAKLAESFKSKKALPKSKNSPKPKSPNKKKK